MFKSFVYKIISVVCILMLSITSCVRGDDSIIAKPATISLSLSIGQATKVAKISRTLKTRTNNGFPTDNGGTGTSEGTINKVCVGLFDKDGNTITIHEYTYTNGKSENILTTTQVTKMVVVANAKSGMFAGATTESNFLQEVQQLSYTTSDNGQSSTNSTTANSQTTTALPMTSGEFSPLVLSGDATTDKAVELTRVVARVSLSSLTTSFDNNGPYAGATFTPTEIFMYNVNDQYAWNGTASASATTVSGESTASTSFAYLGTGVITNYTAPTSTSPQFFYVFPHSSTSPTKLVVKGIFTTNGGSPQTVYYPIVINHAQDGTTFTDVNNNTSTTTTNDEMIEANKTYDINLTIKSIGVNDPSKNIDPSSVTINSHVQNWTQAAVNVNYNDPDVGDYYFSDGSWGTLQDHGTAYVHPIGIVFSNTTSANDRAHGWTHGYAMALTNANTSCEWSGQKGGTRENNVDVLNDGKVNYTYKDYTSFRTDKDGYCETHAVANTRSSNLNLNTFYPAFWYALNYGTSSESETTTYKAPGGSSGWYLPSVGQWLDIAVNLGNIYQAPTDSDASGCQWCGGYDMGGDGKDYTNICASNINLLLTNITTYASNNGYSYGTFDSFFNDPLNNETYWSSSEYYDNSGDQACCMNFYPDDLLYLDVGEKYWGYLLVRSVIAF